MSSELVSIDALLSTGDLLLVQDGNHGGSYPKASEFVSQGVPLITGACLIDGGVEYRCAGFISESTAKRLRVGFAQAGDVLLTHKGTMGKTAIVPASRFPVTILNPQITLYRTSNNGRLDARYLRYFFDSAIFQKRLEQISATSTINTLPIREQKKLEVPLPPISVQKAIIGILGALDDRITLLRETNATLEAIAQALFKSWFVDFDPVRAKTEGRAPEGIDEATAALFPDSFEASELGLVPKGWRVAQVSDLGEVVCGKTPVTSNPDNYGAQVPFITIPDMHGRLAVTSTSRSLSRMGADSQAKKYLPIGSICVSCIATPGLVVQVTTPSQTNQQINSVIPARAWGQSFPLFLLRRIGDAVRIGGSGGSVFHNLSKSGFERLPVLLTDPELAWRFDEVVMPLVRKIIANQFLAASLSTLRDTLLPRLISGQLRISELDIGKEVGSNA